MLYTLLYMSTVRTQIYLTKEQRRRLDARGKRESKSLAALVREALDAYLVERRPEDIQAVLDATFGSMPDLVVPSRNEVVPSRNEWDRGYG